MLIILVLQVQQYKHERECNAVIAQTLEGKIARLESLMDGTLPTEEFMNEEYLSLLNEHKVAWIFHSHCTYVTIFLVEACIYLLAIMLY